MLMTPSISYYISNVFCQGSLNIVVRVCTLYSKLFTDTESITVRSFKYLKGQ